MKSEIEKLNNEIVEMTSRLERQSEISDTLTKKLKQIEQDKQEWMIEGESLRGNLATLGEKLSTSNAEIEKQRTKNESRIEELSNELQQSHVEKLEKNRNEFSECHKRELAAIQEQLRLKEDDFRSAMDKVHVLTEEKAITDSELANLQEMLEQRQNELASLRVAEANTTALYNEALNKISVLEEKLERRERSLTERTMMSPLPEKLKQTVVLDSKEDEDMINTPIPSSSRPQSFNSAFQYSSSSVRKSRKPEW
ncbi:unnamed protein product [Angiostrongylus costaricensis]|uniref:Uncharacterized protein n=1 Tax=Angiostrongylus costaricensis TaxID=334426 RepID=A0A0R3PCN8_ANGCS|nr:unnamed protein product [Angiostrongylus costaricensis]